jgi:two-component system, OmpR family, phosphate regulon sensor histidine kinase PhoR
VSNAIRYTPAGGTIALTWRTGSDGAVVSVQDTGIGVASEHIPRLTERFYRVDKSRSRETGGTGLGLAIVKHVLLRHDGRLDIDSQLGLGSTFSAWLPRARLVAPAVERGVAQAA